MKSKTSKLNKIKKLLSQEILLDISENKKLTISPLNSVFRIYSDEKLHIILFSLELATSYYFYNGISKTIPPVNIIEKSKTDIDTVIKIILTSNEYKDYLFIEIERDKIIVKSVYNRLSIEELKELFSRGCYIN